MRRLGRWAIGLAAVLGLLFVFGPYERVEVRSAFDRGLLEGGVGAYLTAREAAVGDIRLGAEKRVVWYGLEEVPTDYAVVYLHGFSASSEELRPVPDRVAAALGANLVFTRFAGHGRDGTALAGVGAGDWMRDAAEALEIGRAVGHEVIVIATSTGGTVAAVAAHDAAMMRDVGGIVFVSPNFALNHSAAPLLTWPAARYWLPLLGGRTWEFEPRNPAQARHWTTAYPSTALFPLAALVKHARGLDYGGVRVPALFWYSPDDKVVVAGATDRVAAAWGGPVSRAEPALGEGVDPNAHIIAGDILSPHRLLTKSSP